MSLDIRKALYSKLAASAALKAVVGDRVYHAQAPTGAAFPFLIFHKQAGSPTYAMGTEAVKWETWLVKAVDRGSSSQKAEEAMEAADAALNLSTLATSRTFLDLRRVSDVDYLEPDGDQQYRHHGGLYRLAVS